MRVGDNPRNGTREASSPTIVSTCNRTTLPKVRIQPSNPVSSTSMTGRPRIKRLRVCRAGDWEGSGKNFFHSSMCDFAEKNSIRAKRRFRDRWIHDLETTQQALRASGSSWRRSTMRSSISSGREHIAVHARQLTTWSGAGRRYLLRPQSLRCGKMFFSPFRMLLSSSATAEL